MSELLPLPPDVAPKKKSGAKLFFGILFILLGVLFIAGGILAKKHMQLTNEALANQRAHIAELESQIQNMAAHSAPEPGNAPTATSKDDAATIAHLQTDLTAVSVALSALQTEVKATGTIASESKQSAQSSVTSLLAFIQLREAVLAGRKFIGELTSMREAARNNAPLATALEKLSPYADTGVATSATLTDQLIALEGPALQAVSKAQAKTWWDRVVAQLKGLISIRPLHGGGGADFTTMESDLASGDTSAALEALKNLPPDAQDTLTDWRTKAEARATAEQTIHEISSVVGAQGAQQGAP